MRSDLSDDRHRGSRRAIDLGGKVALVTARRVLTGTSADAGAADVGRRARAIADTASQQVQSMGTP
jgi:hypothetical protein